MKTENQRAELAVWFQRHKGILAFSGLAALYLLPFMRFFSAAILESGAVRILHGDVFARDFVELLGPGTFWWNALFMRVFGATFFGARVCLFVTSLGTGVALYYLAKQVCKQYAWLPAVAFFAAYFGGMWPLMSHHTDSNFFTLLAVVCMVLWLDSQQSAWLWIAGFLAAYTSYTLQPKGLFLYFAVLAWLLILSKAGRASLRPALFFTASYAISMAAGLVYFWRQGALWDLIYANLIWPATGYSSVNDVPYGFGVLNRWHELVDLKHGSHVLAVFAPFLVEPRVLIVALPFLLTVLMALRWRAVIEPKILLYTLCGWAMLLSEIHRKEVGHLTSGSPLLLIVFFFLVMQYKEKAADIVMQLVGICSVALAIFNLMLVLAARPLHTRVGTVWTYKNWPALQYLEKHTHPGEYVFCFQYCPSYYFLDEARDPTRYSLLTYNYNTEAQFREAIRDIQKHKVKYVLWQTGPAIEEVYRLLPGADKTPPYGFIVDDYLRRHYHEVKAFSDGMQVWERNGDN